jgi:hypothetical protein
MERHAQIERDQNSTFYPKSTWTITTDFMQDFFSLLNATDQNPGIIQNGIFFNFQVQIEVCAHKSFWLY